MTARPGGVGKRAKHYVWSLIRYFNPFDFFFIELFCRFVTFFFTYTSMVLFYAFTGSLTS